MCCMNVISIVVLICNGLLFIFVLIYCNLDLLLLLHLELELEFAFGLDFWISSGIEIFIWLGLLDVN